MKLYCEGCRKLRLEIPDFKPYNIDIFLIMFFRQSCKCFRMIEINTKEESKWASSIFMSPTWNISGRIKKDFILI